MNAVSRAAGAAIAAAALALPAIAQAPNGLPKFDSTGVGDTSLFAPITLPAPNI